MILEHLEHLAATLTAAGVRTVVDPRAIDPPCAWLTADSLREFYLDGAVGLTTNLYLIARDGPVVDTYRALDELLAPALDAVGAAVADSDLSTSVTLPGGATAPAYRLTLET